MQGTRYRWSTMCPSMPSLCSGSPAVVVGVAVVTLVTATLSFTTHEHQTATRWRRMTLMLMCTTPPSDRRPALRTTKNHGHAPHWLPVPSPAAVLSAWQILPHWHATNRHGGVWAATRSCTADIPDPTSTAHIPQPVPNRLPTHLRYFHSLLLLSYPPPPPSPQPLFLFRTVLGACVRAPIMTHPCVPSPDWPARAS